MKKQFLAVMALATIFASCQKNEETEKVTSEYINVNAGMGSLTRATETEFEKGDMISVYAWAGVDFTTAMTLPIVVNNSINTFDGATTWSAEPQMLWKDMVTAHYFVATYPSQTVTDFKAYEFALTGDLLLDDLLFATNETGLTGSKGESVPLTFSHSQSKIIVNLTFRDQFGAAAPEVEGVTVLAKNVAVVDFTTKTTTSKATATQSELKIVEKTANTAFESVVVPQTINKITITIAGKEYVYNNATGIALVQGKTQTLNLTVGRDVILVGNVIINGWESGEIINGGEADTE